MTMDVAGEELADRVRALLTLDADVEEKRMFGTRAFLIDGHILVGARSGGVLLVRVDEEHGATLVARPGVETAVMGPRTMGTGWLDVAPEVLVDDADLAFWLDAAREDASRDR
ncbi:TfoX/Sxy family protein [Microbacterium hydrocarbonoxydans]|uniref:TfoX N-terminal domain-containing protein n=1 Tax=Microbacterium hydrocarbonoxydans TaxID=273678 RepID=A0A1H4L0C7_9MICO|nr:TfoX/Sxy family protein [Microbacterium hydrocarbonoxydans]SEB63916.1 TfoX N-terminal domain-containing protein [Microbacterium hydrocarbonoxydans]